MGSKTYPSDSRGEQSPLLPLETRPDSRVEVHGSRVAECHHKLCKHLRLVQVTTGDTESPCCVQRFPGTKVSPLQPVLCRRACCWLQSSLGVQLSCPEGTHPSGDLGSWIQRSREPSVIRGNLSIVFTQLSRNGSRVCQSCRQQRLRLRAGDPHWGSALSDFSKGSF